MVEGGWTPPMVAGEVRVPGFTVQSRRRREAARWIGHENARGLSPASRFLREKAIWRSVWLAAIVLASLALTLSGGSLIALVLACGAVAMLRHPVALLAWAAVAILAVTLALPNLPRDNYNVLFDSISIFKPDGVNTADRYTQWQAAAVMVEQNPALGVGMGNYQQNIGVYYGALPHPARRVEDDSQNMYLVIASTLGLPGLACLLGMLMAYGIGAARGAAAAVDAADRGLLLGVCGALLAFSVNCIWSPLMVRGIGIPLALLFALAAGRRKEQEARAADSHCSSRS